ncbi:hypothetical protein CRENBAI_026106 [Crenichthys baileyi]|uniref:Raptor N-terminal CASPase-like domain-containing protein n=1 Tax=Crenichthys baileyi TaxID=28760 RepID=A0AAV9SFV8_9TELE
MVFVLPRPIAQSPGERSRRFPCKHAPVQLAFDGFDLLYRLWTLPYSFLTRIFCATVSLIVRRRRASSPSRVDNPAASRALMKMDSDLLHSPAVGLTEEEEADMNDWKLPLTFMKKRHLEKIEGSKALAQSWRMKDRMKTVSVALVLCLNVGVDPPDVVKTSPCARPTLTPKWCTKACSWGYFLVSYPFLGLAKLFHGFPGPGRFPDKDACLKKNTPSKDPLSMSPQKALETIGANLQKQYENWQPRYAHLSFNKLLFLNESLSRLEL